LINQQRQSTKDMVNNKNKDMVNNKKLSWCWQTRATRYIYNRVNWVALHLLQCNYTELSPRHFLNQDQRSLKVIKSGTVQQIVSY